MKVRRSQADCVLGQASIDADQWAEPRVQKASRPTHVGVRKPNLGKPAQDEMLDIDASPDAMGQWP